MSSAGKLPILYSFRRCPYAMRARLALAAAGLPVEHREVLLRSKPAELLTASPKGSVPVLVLPDGAVVDQSLDIMLWVLRQRDPLNWLAPTNASLADMLPLIDENDSDFKAHLDRYKYPARYPEESAAHPPTTQTPPEFAQQHRAAGANWLAKLETQLVDGWLFGPTASLADMALLPFVRQFAHTDPSWFAAQLLPQTQAWLQAFEASDLYAQVMVKHPTWPCARP